MPLALRPPAPPQTPQSPQLIGTTLRYVLDRTLALYGEGPGYEWIADDLVSIAPHALAALRDRLDHAEERGESPQAICDWWRHARPTA